MTCVECGASSSFWLCSNVCALAHARRRGRRRCAICCYDASTGRIGRNDTMKICADCRRRSENLDWVHKRDEQPDAVIENRLEECQRLRDQQDRPLAPVTPEMARIARLIVEGERIPYQYRDPQGRSFGVRYRLRAYTVRRLARKVGCTPALVQRVIESIEK